MGSEVGSKGQREVKNYLKDRLERKPEVARGLRKVYLFAVPLINHMAHLGLLPASYPLFQLAGNTPKGLLQFKRSELKFSPSIPHSSLYFHTFHLFLNSFKFLKSFIFSSGSLIEI